MSGNTVSALASALRAASSIVYYIILYHIISYYIIV